MSAFDKIAGIFERERKLPPDVPAAIRAALLGTGGSILEIGCGTGRIGAAFVAAGDDYLGVDLSLPMLREFEARAAEARLVCADGAHLPLADASFDTVLMVHLTAAENLAAIIGEARRVLKRNGVLAMGRIESPEDGIDRLMRRRLDKLAGQESRKRPGRDAARDLLASLPARHEHIIAAEWIARRTPRDYILRKQSAPGLAALAAPPRQAALRALADWAEDRFGSLDALREEEYRFALDLYRFGDAA